MFAFGSGIEGAAARGSFATVSASNRCTTPSQRHDRLRVRDQSHPRVRPGQPGVDRRGAAASICLRLRLGEGRCSRASSACCRAATLTLRRGRIRDVSYWDVELRAGADRTRSERELIRAFDGRSSTNRSAAADERRAARRASLSGGLTRARSPRSRAKLRQRPANTFSVGFEMRPTRASVRARGRASTSAPITTRSSSPPTISSTRCRG